MGRLLVDTCVYSNFALIGRYELLETLHGKALIVLRLVETEIKNGIPSLPKLEVGLRAIAEGRLDVLDDVTEDELRTAQELPRKFSAADRVGLAVALHRKWELVTDERSLLRECAARGVATVRTEDLLLEAVEKGLLAREDLSKVVGEMEREASFRPNV